MWLSMHHVRAQGFVCRGRVLEVHSFGVFPRLWNSNPLLSFECIFICPTKESGLRLGISGFCFGDCIWTRPRRFWSEIRTPLYIRCQCEICYQGPDFVAVSQYFQPFQPPAVFIVFLPISNSRNPRRPIHNHLYTYTPDKYNSSLTPKHSSNIYVLTLNDSICSVDTSRSCESNVPPRYLYLTKINNDRPPKMYCRVVPLPPWLL